MRDILYRRPWEGKAARCPACGTTGVLTDRDRPNVDTENATPMHPIEGGQPILVGTVIFWMACPSCAYKLELAVPV